jgi:hypothetical protein
MLPFYHILIVGGVILWDCVVVAYVVRRTLRRPTPKLLKTGRKRKLSRADGHDVTQAFDDFYG